MNAIISGRSRSSGPMRRLRKPLPARAALCVAACAALLLPRPVPGAPAGGTVSAGSGAISQQGALTRITQQSPRMAIDWNSFSSAAGESIVFAQPNAAAIALNRVTGASPSQLMGSLVANGQVFILNPNGVLFGPGATVEVGGLLASTLAMDNAGFMNGSQVLQGGSKAGVINEGSLKAADGGYIALVGPAVSNRGTLAVDRGDAVLAAGDKVTLRLEGASLLGYSMDAGSLNALVDNGAGGVIRASGGRVALEARAADVLSKAVVNHAGLIEAQTLQGQGGSIRLIGDPQAGQTTVSGRLDASAPRGGDGGFIETSAAQVNIADSARVTTAAAAGATGHWLVDPLDFEIAAGSGAQSNSTIGASTLATALGQSSVTIGAATGSAGSGRGDITVNADVTWTAGTRLTLSAYRDIIFNASLRGPAVSLRYGQESAHGGAADFRFNNGAKIDLTGTGSTGIFTTQKGSDPANLKNYAVVRSLGAAGSTDTATLQGVRSPLATDNYVLGADIDASATAGWNDGLGFSPLGELHGTFDGLGHRIADLNIHYPNGSVIGLFGSVRNGAAVHNLNLENVAIAGDDAAGALAGSNLGTVSRVTVTGKVSGRLQAGGLVGINVGLLSDTHSSASVSGNELIGGLAGVNDTGGIVSGSTAAGAVLASDLSLPAEQRAANYAGGLLGFNRGSVVGSYASGSTNGNAGVGGLVGGSNGTIEDSYALGPVSGLSFVGGLAGRAAAGSTIRNTYASGAVQGADPATTRGLVGESPAGVVTNSYWNTDSIAAGGTGQEAPGEGLGKTGAQLRQAATFANWDLASAGGSDKVWRIYEGNSMPLLRSFLAPLALDPAKSAIYNGAAQQNAAIPASGARTGTAASGRNVGTYRPYSNQQGYDISNGELDITPFNLVFSVSAADKDYDGTTMATATVAGNQIRTDDLFAKATAGFDNKNAGLGKTVTVTDIALSGADAGNYTLTMPGATTANIRQRLLDLSASASDKVYDGTTEARVSLTDNRVQGDLLNASAVASFADKNAGAGKEVTISDIALGGADAANYRLSAAALKASASITPRPLAVTATAADKTYDGSTGATALLADDRIAGDVISASYQRADFSDRNAGAQKTVTVSNIAIAGADARNYSANVSAAASASIMPRPLAVTATAADKAYDGNTRTTALLADDRLAGDTISTSYQRAEFGDKNGGERKPVTVSGIAVGGADAGNYVANASAATTASISPIGLVITANPDRRRADGMPYQGGNGVVYAGLLPGETPAVLDGELRYGGSAQGATQEGVYRITPGGLSSANYATSYVDGVLTIVASPPGIGSILAYTEASVPIRSSAATPAGQRSGAGMTEARIADCAIRMPENLLVGGCQSGSTGAGGRP